MLDLSLRQNIDNSEEIIIKADFFDVDGICQQGRDAIRAVLGDSEWKGTRREASEACLKMGLGRWWWWAEDRLWSRDLTRANLADANLTDAVVRLTAHMIAHIKSIP
jgi:hypothetical protein